MKAHICIGGPLNGEFAASIDFHGRWDKDLKTRERGMYEHLAADYAQFHNAYSSRRRAHVAWIHVDLLPMPKALRDR